MLKKMCAYEREKIKERLLKRGTGNYNEVFLAVEEIVNQVRDYGDDALFTYTKKLDNFDISNRNFEVSGEEIEVALNCVDKRLIDVMKKAAANIEEFHKRQKRENWKIEKSDGSYVGQIYLPVESAGVYVPGGKAAYPSSVLMNIIPARCAGVEEICVATPARGGEISYITLVAAHIAGATRIFKIGGAQAIAAFAYGTNSIPKTDVIVGPGNIYVAIAKKLIFGQSGVDMIAGPSEVCVIADKHANADFVAADLLSQAEHDELAACILLTDNEPFAEKVNKSINLQLKKLGRRDIAGKSLNNFGTAIICNDINECLEIANLIAPEHLEICTINPEGLLPGVKNAGSIFLGEYSPEPLGDYFAGTNHVLPTNGTARFSSPLNIDNFQKKSGVVYYSKEALSKVHMDIENFAQSEGLGAHANSIKIRFGDTNDYDY